MGVSFLYIKLSYIVFPQSQGNTGPPWKNSYLGLLGIRHARVNTLEKCEFVTFNGKD